MYINLRGFKNLAGLLVTLSMRNYSLKIMAIFSLSALNGSYFTVTLKGELDISLINPLIRGFVPQPILLH
jgi:hypothetical protein